MRRECVKRNSGAPRAFAAGAAASDHAGPAFGRRGPATSAVTRRRPGAPSGSFGCGETATSLPPSATPQHRAAALVDRAWSQWLEQQRSARRTCAARAGAPYAASTPNAVSASSADAMSRFADTRLLRWSIEATDSSAGYFD